MLPHGYRQRYRPVVPSPEPPNVGDVAALLRRSSSLMPDVDASTVALWLFATRAGRMTEAVTRAVLAEQGIDGTEFSILVVLWLNQVPHRTTMGDLADAVVLSQPGITRALQRAERKGAIRKRPDPTDRRAVIIELTSTGRRIVDASMRLVLERLKTLVGDRLSSAQTLTIAGAAAQYAVALGQGT